MLIVVLALVGCAFMVFSCSIACAEEYPPFNTRVGTQSFKPNYQFTDEPWLLETAREMYAMGSDIFKFRVPMVAHPDNPEDVSPRNALQFDPVHTEILNMDFRTYFMWVHAWKKQRVWQNGLSDEDAKDIYGAIYDLASWFLEEFQNTGKTFCIGHWEGDWLLRQAKAGTEADRDGNPGYDQVAEHTPTSDRAGSKRSSRFRGQSILLRRSEPGAESDRGDRWGISRLSPTTFFRTSRPI